jgi:6-phosphogluconolactonase
MNLHVGADPVRALAERVAAVLRRNSPSYIALSGGSTPRPLYRLLATEYRDTIPWDRVTILQVDERPVPQDHPDSNWRMIHEELVSRVPDVTAYPVPTDADDPAREYEHTLRNVVPHAMGGVPVLDLVLLGMGADGHTASLFPDTAALEERERLVVVNDVPRLGTRRITLTYPVLERAARRWFLVTGADKAPALREVKQGRLPAGRLRNTEWFIDPAVVSRG